MGDNFYIKIRAYGLAALYVSLAIFAMLLTLAAFKLWPFASGGVHTLTVLGTAFSGISSTFLQGRAAHRIINALNQKLEQPSMEFIPLMVMALCMMLSSWLVLGVEQP